MCKWCIFGGTTEGRELAQWFAENHIEAYVSVATEYGAQLLPGSEYLHVSTERLDQTGMEKIFREKSIQYVIDATHPYAVEVSKNIIDACQNQRIKNYRIIRSSNDEIAKGRYFNSISEAAGFLNQCRGRALITTGSKEIAEFLKVKNYSQRCTVRILNVPEIAEMCRNMGFIKIIAERGPFSVECNIRHLKESGAEYLVTKDSGSAGGFDEKIKAALFCNVIPIIIRRPKEMGIFPDEMMRIIADLEKKNE